MSLLSSQADMPSLTNVTLVKARAFKEKTTVHTKSISTSSLSFLDITSALQYYLEYSLSFTHQSSTNPNHTSKHTELAIHCREVEDRALFIVHTFITPESTTNPCTTSRFLTNTHSA